MRVPIPLVIFLALAVAAAVWWRETREMDFLTPPTDEELAAIRERVESSIPQPGRPQDAISVPTDPPAPSPPRGDVTPAEPPEAKPVVELGDLSTTPGLRAYAELTPKGAAYLIELASLLESKGEFQRALLAWERVLDLAQATPEQEAVAISALRRLRPTLPDWNIDPEGAIPVVLHAATAKGQAKAVQPGLEQAARVIQRASSGILQVKPEISANPSAASTGGEATPVAVRLAGAGEASASTEVLSFRPGDPEKLADEVMATVFRLVRNYLDRSPMFVTPPPLGDDEAPAEALEYRLTRLAWRDFAAALNLSTPEEE